MTIESIIDALIVKGIHSVLTQFSDIHGVAKSKRVPLKNLREWVGTSAGFAGPSIGGTGLGRFAKRSEYYARFNSNLCDHYPLCRVWRMLCVTAMLEAKPLATCSRHFLKHQLQRLIDGPCRRPKIRYDVQLHA